MRNEEKEINQMDNNEVVVAEEVAAVAENNTGIEIRSEERRVGKECRL